LSKLSKLKQEAYLAGKKRNWDEAVSLYERIIEVDKNNPTLINELGDLCLRKGDIPRAIELFLSAAANYRSTGLHNNAVAIYKKILRHDSDNFNAHWSLAELRASQGLSVDGENHALRFLAASDRISSEVKEIFLKRCSQMLTLYSNSLGVLEKLTEVFRFWSMSLEAARARALVLCLVFDGGEEDPARAEMKTLLERQRDLENYPEYRLWLQKTQPGGARPAEYADVNALDLSPAGSERQATPSLTGAAKSSSPSGEEISFGGLMDDEAPSPGAPAARPTPAGAVATRDQAPEGSFDDLLSGIAATETAPTPAAANAAMPEKSEDGCFEIDADDTASLDDLISDPGLVAGEPPGKSPPASPPVDLLAEILADGDADLGQSADRQVSTIASEIGQRVGGDGAPDDPERQYEMGMVYLEMGMFEQAVICLSAAADDPDYAVQAFEMWGITLLRQQQPEEAIAIFERGLSVPEATAQEQVGLLYHAGRAHEDAGRPEQAREFYTKVHAVQPTFLDVIDRLRKLGGN
jgi:tetratricopeptide (TPR) repeat protein